MPSANFRNRSISLKVSSLRILGSFLAVLAIAPTVRKGNDEFKPALTLDLHQFGYEVPNNARVNRIFPTPHQVVAFVDDNTLAVSLFVRNPHPGLSVRGKVFGGRYLFQTTFLGARSGNVLHTETWSNSTVWSGLFPARNGSFVVWHDLELSLHAADGAIVKSLTLDPKDFPRGASVEQSPSGNTLFAESSDRTGNHILRIRTQDLEMLSWLHLGGYLSGVGSDSYFAFLRDHPDSVAPPPMDVFARSIAEADDPKSGMNRIFTTSPGCSRIVFLDDRTIGVSGMCRDLTILDISGEVLFHRKFGEALTGGITGCRNCDVAVSSTFAVKGGSEFLDIPQHAEERSIIFLNRKTKQLVEVPRSARVRHSASAALSPNGCLLAIQNDSELEIYEVCDSAIGMKLRSN